VTRVHVPRQVAAREAMEREASDEKLNMDGAFSAKQPVIPCKQNTTV
jgi:hypothetical protein